MLVILSILLCTMSESSWICRQGVEYTQGVYINSRTYNFSLFLTEEAGYALCSVNMEYARKLFFDAVSILYDHKLLGKRPAFVPSAFMIVCVHTVLPFTAIDDNDQGPSPEANPFIPPLTEPARCVKEVSPRVIAHLINKNRRVWSIRGIMRESRVTAGEWSEDYQLLESVLQQCSLWTFMIVGGAYTTPNILHATLISLRAARTRRELKSPLLKKRSFSHSPKYWGQWALKSADARWRREIENSEPFSSLHSRTQFGRPSAFM